ncbi:MAG: tetratricopeptide repeat protein [Desulfovibrionaceae bacterium]|nr:tetratricopeptide repeat protein [Desulfovibrionaceae bacterium]
MRRISLLAAALFLALAFPSEAFSSPGATQGPDNATKTSHKADKGQKFEDWLQDYAAWDKVQESFAPDDDSPEAVLSRAGASIRLGQARRAIETLEMTPAFADNATETRRLWLGGQAWRAAGQPAKAILWFAHAAGFMDDNGLRKAFSLEPGLEDLWLDNWRKSFWSWALAPARPSVEQAALLEDSLAVAKRAWPRDPFWDQCAQALRPEGVEDRQVQGAGPQAEPKPDPSVVSDPDRVLIAKALISLSLHDFESSNASLGQIQAEALRAFWCAVAGHFRAPKAVADPSMFREANFPKPAAFWEGRLLERCAANNARWFLGDPGSSAWTKFRDNLLAMAPGEALEVIDKESASLLISSETAALLRVLRFAMGVLEDAGEYELRRSWAALDPAALPVPIKVAGLILLGPEAGPVSGPDNPLVSCLCEAAGVNLAPGVTAPFWLQASKGNLHGLARNTRPLDRLLVLADWLDQWSQRPSQYLAKRASLLFRDTGFGDKCVLYLAQEALKERDFRLAKFYTDSLDPEALGPEMCAARLEVLARIELEKGNNDKALELYRQILAIAPDAPYMVRLQYALLLQQKGELAAGRGHLLLLWERRDDLPPAIQAEVLFWLGEGEQAMGDEGAALDHYLRLAWLYPKENIWALTAMYRSAMIYEKRGNFETAKRLLHTVIKQAERKEQREAAKARLSAIEAKAGKSQDRSETGDYPF